MDEERVGETLGDKEPWTRNSIGAPEIRFGDGDMDAGPLHHSPAGTGPPGFEPGSPFLQKEVSVACAPGAPMLMSPEIKTACGVISFKEVAAAHAPGDAACEIFWVRIRIPRRIRLLPTGLERQ